MNYPVLYKANETDFSTLGLGALTSEIETLIPEERNGQFYLEMEYPVNGLHFNKLKVDRIIKAKANPKLDNQRFKIIRITKPAKGVVTVYAEHVSNHTADLQLKPKLSYSGNAQQALNTWKNNIVDDHPFTVYSDINTTGSGQWDTKEVENARRALGGVQGSILDTYGGEYAFDNYHIRLLRNRGNDNGTPIMYGKNLIDLEQEEEIASTYTSIMPHASYLPEDADEHVEITLPEYFVDSEYVGNYARRKILKVDFTADEITTVEELRARAKRYIKDNDIGIPNVNLRVKFVDLARTLDYKDRARVENIGLCDWVPVYFNELGINQKAKVIKVVFNRTLDRYEELEIGEARASLSQSINSTVDSKLDNVRNEVNEVRVAANGKNKNFWGETEPTEGMSEGDTWFKQIGDGEEEIHRYVNGEWKFILSTADTTKNARDIRDALAELSDVKETANEANNQINTAISNAGFTTLDDTISSVQTISNQAQINASTAIDNAFEAMQQASQAIDNTGSLNVRVDEVENILSVKADKQTVADLTGVVDSQTLDIQANAQGLALKANKDTVDRLEGTVSSLGTDIGVVAGQINQRVWNADIETAIDGIEVGGRNYFPNEYLSNRDNWNLHTYSTTKEILQLEGNTRYTLHAPTLKGLVNGWGVFNIHDGTDGVKQWRQEGYNESRMDTIFNKRNMVNDEENFEFTFVTPKSGRIFFSYYDDFHGNSPEGHWVTDRLPFAKMELGNIKTDWSPAPEDTLARFDHIETEWTQTFDSFSQTVAGIDGRVTTQKQTIDSISSTVSGHGDRISTVEQTASGLQSTVADKANQSQVTQLSGLLSSTVEDVEGNATQISQLSNNINLRVAKNDVINQINISDENILIQSENILLDGDVTVRGTAWMDGAVIANASIDGAKIQDATIGSAKIANLDAGKITFGTLEGIRAEIDEGLVGGWSLEKNTIYKQTPYGFTTLKPGGGVAIGISSPEINDTSGAKIQIWHDGRLRFLNDRNIGSILKASDISNTGLEIESSQWINIKAGNRMVMDGHIIPKSNRQFSLGLFSEEWENVVSKSFRVGQSGVFQHTTTSGGSGNTMEIYANHDIELKPANGYVRFHGGVIPYNNNTYTLGSSSFRWKNVFLINQPIIGSDERYKKKVQNIPEGLIKQLSEIQPKMYQLNDDDSGDWHFGYIAQDVERAIYKHATSMKKWETVKAMREYAESFAMLHKDNHKLSLLYGEIAVIKAAETQSKIEELENRIKELENAS